MDGLKRNILSKMMISETSKLVIQIKMKINTFQTIGLMGYYNCCNTKI